MWAELKTMLWLQVKLTGSMFRSRRTADRLYLTGLLSRILMLLFSLPVFVAMGCGLAIGPALLPTGAAYELAMLVNSAMFFVGPPQLTPWQRSSARTGPS